MSMHAEQDDDAAVAALIAGYRPSPGVADEMLDSAGAIRPHWRQFLQQLATFDGEGRAQRFAAADRHLRDAGVFYRVYEGLSGAERPWPLSHMPVMIAPDEWRALTAGLIQRAAILEAVLADCFGPGNLVKAGIVPAAVIAGSPEFLRPLVGIKPRGGRFLSHYAVDLGRGPDGRWWVLGDRTQAPSGAGYALENRIALSRAMPDLYRGLKVERLAGFFQAYRAALTEQTDETSARVCLLTPGPLNETYFEHAYLARYLGFLLVEGSDLTVQDDCVYVRTVQGLVPASVIVRRLDADFCDPLAFNIRSRIGVPGLLRAVEAGNVTLTNALGSGLVEAPALMAFMPTLARHLTGQKLAIPNVATWWCGQEEERRTTLERLDQLVIGPAFDGYARDVLPDGPVLGSQLEPDRREAIIAAMRHRGMDFVGQEAVRLSTTPAWVGGRLQPRPCILRLYLTATAEGWQVMPGGFCRIADHEDDRAISMQRGGRSADVWVLSEGPVRQTTLLPPAGTPHIRRRTGSLPSRVADNQFWIGRYAERAEAILRICRALHARAAESDEDSVRVVERLTHLLRRLGALNAAADPSTGLALARHVVCGHHSGSLPAVAASLRQCASVIRDRLAPDTWQTIVTLDRQLARAGSDDLYPVMDEALRTLSAFAGLSHDNMVRQNGWRFLKLGRRIERALTMTRIIRVLSVEANHGLALDALLEIGDCQITYGQRYVFSPVREPVLDLLVFDGENPRSLAFQAERIVSHVDDLPGADAGDVLSPMQRSARRLLNLLQVTELAEVDDTFFDAVQTQLLNLSEQVGLTFFGPSPQFHIPVEQARYVDTPGAQTPEGWTDRAISPLDERGTRGSQTERRGTEAS